MKVLYITYIDFGEYKSGSAVRPQKMYDAFLKEGHEVILLETQQNKRKKRIEAVKKVIDEIENENIDICYIESPSGPIFNRIDLRLIKKVKRKAIPIGFFYRDAYWLFAKSWTEKSVLKSKIIEIMQRRDIKIFQKHIDQFYMPSEKACVEMLKYYKFKCIKALPPGTDYGKFQAFKTTNTAIYVGGSSYHYGVDLLINVYKKLNKSGNKYNLIIVTRKDDWDAMFPDNLSYQWLEVYHVSGDKLDNLYKKADLAILPQRKDFYSDMAYGIKMMEYISHGKPIISNNLEMMGGFVDKYKCGLIFNETEESMKAAIIKFYSEENLRRSMHKNIETACRENTWEKRVEAIVGDLNN